MKKRALTMAAALWFSASLQASADDWVSGYTRSDGTYVQGHFRSNPNSYQFDNYSAEGNRNPYTGEYGIKPPEYTGPSSDNRSYDGFRSFDHDYDYRN
jgi:hypothetical protein